MNEDHWSRYYRGGRLVTGPAGPDGGYDQEIRAVWLDFFSGLPASATVLDLGTGNGAIALLAQEHALTRGAEWAIHGTDRTAIDPRRFAQIDARRFGAIRFHPGVAAEALPFADASVDAFCAQYALEYTDRARSLGELSRVLRPGASAQLVLHHVDSVLLRNAQQTQQAMRWLQQRTVYELLRADRAEQPQALDALLTELREAIAAAPQDPGTPTLAVTLDALVQLRALRSRLDAQRWAQEVLRAQTELDDALRRLEELCDCALSAQAMAELRHALSQRGLECADPQLLHHAGQHLVGWLLRLHKR
jgi:ubiquinone/menaquinone biosynthesis C-methylase UbiE